MNQVLTLEASFPPKVIPVLFTPKRFKVLWGGRGAGRSWSVARFLLLESIKRKIRVLCARELQKSVDESVHQVLCDQIKLLGLEQYFVIQKSKIFSTIGSEFIFEGIKNNVTAIKSFEGIDYCWVEEANKVTKNSWGHLIPTIRKEGSEIIITFNPELENDYTYKRFVLGADPETSFVVHMTFRDNPWFPDVLMKDLLTDKRNDEDHYVNIWEGRCIQQLEGAVYAKQMRALSASGRITRIVCEPLVPVDVYFDLGKRHNTSMWFYQYAGMQHRVLAFHQEKGEEVGYYVKYLQNSPYKIGLVVLPHDAKAKRLGMKTTVEEQFRQHFKVLVLPRMGLNDGIEATKAFLGSAWFDEELTVDGRMALARYRFELDKDGHYSRTPDENCDEADAAAAMRYLALRAGGRVMIKDRGRFKELLEETAEAIKKFERPFTRRERGPGGGQGWMQ